MYFNSFPADILYARLQMMFADFLPFSLSLCVLVCWQLCLLAKCMKPAVQFLDVDITDISKEVCFRP